MNNDAGQLAHWFDSYRNQPIHIVKEEQDDIDEIQLELSEAGLARSARPDPDGYVASQALLLRGKGIVRNGGHEAPLPQDVYEIALEGNWESRTQQSNLIIQTGRAVYTISKPSNHSQVH